MKKWAFSGGAYLPKSKKVPKHTKTREKRERLQNIREEGYGRRKMNEQEKEQPISRKTKLSFQGVRSVWFKLCWEESLALVSCKLSAKFREWLSRAVLENIKTDASDTLIICYGPILQTRYRELCFYHNYFKSSTNLYGSCDQIDCFMWFEELSWWNIFNTQTPSFLLVEFVQTIMSQRHPNWTNSILQPTYSKGKKRCFSFEKVSFFRRRISPKIKKGSKTYKNDEFCIKSFDMT